MNVGYAGSKLGSKLILDLQKEILCIVLQTLTGNQILWLTKVLLIEICKDYVFNRASFPGYPIESMLTLGIKLALVVVASNER